MISFNLVYSSTYISSKGYGLNGTSASIVSLMDEHNNRCNSLVVLRCRRLSEESMREFYMSLPSKKLVLPSLQGRLAHFKREFKGRHMASDSLWESIWSLSVYMVKDSLLVSGSTDEYPGEKHRQQLRYTLQMRPILFTEFTDLFLGSWNFNAKKDASLNALRSGVVSGRLSFRTIQHSLDEFHIKNFRSFLDERLVLGLANNRNLLFKKKPKTIQKRFNEGVGKTYLRLILLVSTLVFDSHYNPSPSELWNMTSDSSNPTRQRKLQGKIIGRRRGDTTLENIRKLWRPKS